MSKFAGRLISVFTALIAIVLFAIGVAAKNMATISLSVFVMWAAALLRGITQTKRNFIFILFLVSFFVFLLSRVMVRWYENQEIYYPFDTDTMIMTYTCLFLALAGLYLGTIGHYRILVVTKENAFIKSIRRIGSDTDKAALRKASGVFTIISGFATMAVVMERILYWGQVGSGGELRVSFGSALPGIVLRFSYVYVLMFCIYLATLPEKRKTVPVLVQFLLCGALKMVYGSRSDFILGLMFIVVYYVIRDRIEENRDIHWFGMAEKIFTVISIPFLIILIVFVGYYRTHTTFAFSGFFNTLLNFFETQGTSIDILGYTKTYASDLPQPRFLYMFDRSYEFLSANPLIGKIVGKTTYAANTAERALYGTSLGQTLYYYINRASFLAGYGCGSSYIAEIWVGYGYIGVVIWNYIMSRIMFRINEYKFTNLVLSVIILVYLQSLFFMPRAGFDGFVDDFSSMTHIFMMVLLWVIYRVLKSKKTTAAGFVSSISLPQN